MVVSWPSNFYEMGGLLTSSVGTGSLTTSVNGVKVGKDKEHRLEHAVIIAILQSNYDLFRFVNEARLKPM